MENQFKTTCLQIDVGKPIGIRFNAEIITSTKFGTASVNGIIPLLLPMGSYSYPLIIRDISKFKEIVKQYVSEYRHLWPNELDETIEAKAKDYLITGLHLIGKPFNQDISHPIMKAWICLLFATFAIDDLLDSLNEFSDLNLSYKHLQSYIEFFDNLFDDVYKSKHEIPNVIQALEPSYSYFLNFVQMSARAVPGYTERNACFKGEWVNSLRGWILLMEQNSLPFSKRTKTLAGAHVSSGLPGLEYFALVQGVTLRNDVRADILFKILRDASASACHLINDLIGLNRDIELNQIRDSSILRRVQNTGIDLQTVFEDTLGQLREEICDIQLLCKLLLECYEDDNNLVRYLHIFMGAFDGQCHAYLEVSRYGDIDLHLVEI